MALSSDIKKAIDDMLKTSTGKERKVYISLKEYFKKSDSVNVDWNKAYNAFVDSRILDFTKLNNAKEFEFQKNVVQNYVDQSENFKLFIQNRVANLTTQTKYIDRNNKAFKGFIRGITSKDSIQKPIFIPYINAHIKYGKEIKGIIEILEQQNGKWQYENEMLIFENTESQAAYEKLLNQAIQNEEVVNDLVDKLVEII